MKTDAISKEGNDSKVESEPDLTVVESASSSEATEIVIPEQGTEIETGSTLIDWVEVGSDYVPLFQTVAWIALIVFLLFRFKSEVGAVISALKNRIEEGAPVKVGTVEFGQVIQTQSKTEQAEKLEQESRESQSSKQLPSSSSSAQDFPSEEQFRTHYVLSEDLALRKIQYEFGSPIARQIRIGDGLLLDGFFAVENVPFGVEVKLVSKSVRPEMLFAQADRIHSQIKKLHWKRFNLIIAVVVHGSEESVKRTVADLRERMEDLPSNTLFRIYEFEKLKEDFGIDTAYESNKAE